MREWLALFPGECQCYATGTMARTMSGTTAADPAQTPDRPPAAAPRRSWWSRFRGLPRAVRWGTWTALVVVLLVVGVLVTTTVLTRLPLPQTTGTLEVAGLDGEVEVVRDEHGIPQIYADSVPDLMRAQGFVHAQDRFFEMDVRRHITAGRMAELFGESAVETDVLVRTMGWRRVAEAELPLLEPATRDALSAYAEGVNAYLAQHDPTQIAVEYTVLGLTGLDYRPAEWTPVDSLAWLKAMAWDLRGNMTAEIERGLLGDHFAEAEEATGLDPEQALADLYPPYPYEEHRTIVDQGRVVDGVFEQDATRGGTRVPERPRLGPAVRDQLERLGERLDAMPALVGRGDGIGSNSWVVDGDHSSTGAPLLANDPHLGVSMPGVWTQVGLHCRTVSEACPLEVAGFGFAGVPGVIIGHNADIAWGFTNLDPDVADLYVERVRGENWVQDGRLQPLRTREETIEVAGGDDVTITVRSTAHGPILSDADEALDEVLDEVAEVAPSEEEAGRARRDDEEYAVSLAWTALEPGTTADAILALNLAGDWDEFRAAAADFEVPAQNLVYADREGHIGYQAPGRIPIRKSGNDGSVPSAGWRSENDWTGEYVPTDGLPSVLDPEEGFVATANQAVVGEDYPYFLTDDWDRGYRAERIRQLLLEEGELSMREMLQLQLDDHHPLAPVLVPYLLDVDLPGGYYSDGQRLLEEWDFGQGADSAAAAYFNVVWRRLLAATFHDQVPAGLWPGGGSRWFGVVEELLTRPADAWWDDVTTDDVTEDRDDVIAAVMQEARDELTSRQSPRSQEWRWGDLHELELRSPTLGESGIGLVERLVNRGPWEVGGGSSTVDATSWDATEGYGVVAAPSMRMVVSMADLDDSRWIGLTGVSGHPASPHYTDQTDLWADGQTLPWAFTRDAVDAAADDVLTLVPAEEE
ncbi:penicillin acylase family protein [Nocardioides nanhaiensis]|uniref:Penicillin acylase family protein n=2 Tax=Nocardioides nanhaiensis TaxID=1476871 RepID=A0ABP8W7F9_9ACTN